MPAKKSVGASAIKKPGTTYNSLAQAKAKIGGPANAAKRKAAFKAGQAAITKISPPLPKTKKK